MINYRIVLVYRCFAPENVKDMDGINYLLIATSNQTDRALPYFSLPYFWPDQKFDILFMTVRAGTVALNIIYKGLMLIDYLIDTDEKSSFFSKAYLNSRIL